MIDGLQSHSMMNTDREPHLTDKDVVKRNPHQFSSVTSSQVKVPAPCNTKQFNTINASMDATNSSQTGFFRGSSNHQNSKQLKVSHKSGDKMTQHSRAQHLQPKKSISNDVEDGPKNLRPARGVNSMNLNNNSMNSTSL